MTAVTDALTSPELLTVGALSTLGVSLPAFCSP
jgi:hypothetical protein